MCDTYQQRDQDDCLCHYTFAMMKKQMADESRPYRKAAGWLVWAVCRAAEGALNVIGWAVYGVVWVAVWAYNDMFPLVDVPAPAAAPVARPAPVAAPVAKAKPVAASIPVVDWPREQIHILKNSGGAK